MMRVVTVLSAQALLCSVLGAAEVNLPRALVDGVRVELVASEPDIVTPVGLALDRSGRLLIVESHTHKRKQDYDGPQGDRIRTLTDTDGDGKFDQWGTFAEGYTHALNLVVHPTSGDVFLACRNEVRRLRDTNDDGIADQEVVIVRCETKENYPHNALGGIALSLGDGSTTYSGVDRLWLGFGENFGASYRLVGADGSSLAGRGGVGIVFRCGLDGGELQKYAVGFWNPFGLCEAQNRLFCIDNDPDASPPCRLIHVQPAGDYGHRWEYGRAGLHPLQAWDGELPGTLGMMAGTGEAPCTVLWQGSALWVSSWGEHRIERYWPSYSAPNTFTARREVVVQGDASFRPTGMVEAADGSIYVADWVSRSYPVHGAGRIWRITTPPTTESSSALVGPAQFRLDPQQQIFGHATEPERFQAPSSYELQGDATERLRNLQALRFREADPATARVREALNDPDPDVRLYAVRWIADEHRTEYKQDVAKLLAGELPSERYYLAVVAAIDWLTGERKPRHSRYADGLLARELRNKQRTPAIKTIALRMIDPNHKQLSPEVMETFLNSDHQPLQSEAVRTLGMQSQGKRISLLKRVVADKRLSETIRADAVAALASDATNQQPLLKRLASDESEVVRREAERVLRLSKLIPRQDEQKPAADDLPAWLQLLAKQPGDADSGRRLFHSAVGARCAVCHQHSGRGGRIGPELAHTAKKLSRQRLIESILQPSAEMAPQYTPWVLETDDGRVLTGLRLPQGGDNGKESYADSEGKRFTLRSEQVEYRTPSKASIMPQGLEQTVSVQDLRDLLAFLEQG